ncbi:MAG: hypothetical protein J1E62_08345 [Lachnospiraceae bacterium]|nr:hypothetical protein [Lachnospiraceae bacterium]
MKKIFLMYIIFMALALTSCGSTEKGVEEEVFTGDNLQPVIITFKYYSKMFDKLSDITIYINGMEIDTLSEGEGTYAYCMYLDPGEYTIKVNRDSVWSSYDIEVQDYNDINIFTEQYFHLGYKCHFWNSKSEIIQREDKNIGTIDDLSDDKYFLIDLLGTQDDKAIFEKFGIDGNADLSSDDKNMLNNLQMLSGNYEDEKNVQLSISLYESTENNNIGSVVRNNEEYELYKTNKNFFMMKEGAKIQYIASVVDITDNKIKLALIKIRGNTTESGSVYTKTDHSQEK